MLALIRAIQATIIIALCAIFTPAMAQDTGIPDDFTLSGTVTVISDYTVRGLSQSNGDPAIQGGITASHKSGLYAKVWASSTEFKGLGPAADAALGNLELDYTGGWTGEVSPGLTVDVGLTLYTYPGGKAGHANFSETFVSLTKTVGPASAKIGINYAWKQKSLDTNGDGRRDANLYVWGDVSAAIPSTPVTVTAHLGWTKGALSPKFLTRQTANYAGGLDWSLTATATVHRNLTLGVSYIGVEGTSQRNYSGDRVALSLRLSF